MTSRRAAPAALAIALASLAAWPERAVAYDGPVHAALPEWAFRATRGPWLDEKLPVGQAADLEALRRALYDRLARLPDAALRQRFLARYPTRERFDARALKAFFALSTAARVHGIDDVPHAPRAEVTRGEVLRDGSSFPDTDARNQDRLQRDDRGQPLRDRWGQLLPEDPATLDMGSLTGGASQGHAHYQLVPGPKSSDPDVLKRDPRRFATRPDIQSFGADFAQLYTDLALLAALLPELESPARGYWTALYSGFAYHHIGDVANQIHTVQVGIYAFFVDAKVGSLLEDLRTLGGLVGERHGFFGRGLRIVKNHHFFSEQLYRKRLLAVLDPRTRAQAPAIIRETVRELVSDDAFLPKQIPSPRPGTPPAGFDFGRAITFALVELSSHEGPQVYALARALLRGRERRGSAPFEETDDPDAFLVDPESPETRRRLDAFYRIQGRGLRRAATGLRAWQQRFDVAVQQATADEAAREAAITRVLERLVRERLAYLDAADARRRAYRPRPPAGKQYAVWVPVSYTALLGGGLLLWAWLRQRRQQRRRAQLRGRAGRG